MKGALVSQVGSSCPALCPREQGPVGCHAHHFHVCTMETPLCSLSWAEGTFDFKSCCNKCLNSGRCSLTLWSQHSPPPLSCGLPDLRVHTFPSQGTSWHTSSTPSKGRLSCAVLCWLLSGSWHNSNPLFSSCDAAGWPLACGHRGVPISSSSPQHTCTLSASGFGLGV